MLETDHAEAGKAYLGFHGKAHAGFQRRGKAPSECRPLVEIQAYAVAEEGKLVLAEARMPLASMLLSMR